eukprot:UN13434
MACPHMYLYPLIPTCKFTRFSTENDSKKWSNCKGYPYAFMTKKLGKIERYSAKIDYLGNGPPIVFIKKQENFVNFIHKKF